MNALLIGLIAVATGAVVFVIGKGIVQYDPVEYNRSLGGKRKTRRTKKI